ncbi:nitroreductase family protein [Akkermansiaceae bacterium]|nr:nitroreductase family protein [Akkermansiaceae bacterium]
MQISDIVRQYHRIEKAMCKKPYDSSRGLRAVDNLTKLLKRYEVENDQKSCQFYVGILVLKKFFLKNNDETSDRFKSWENLDKYDKEIPAGVEITNKNYFIENSSCSFEKLARSRKSIRYFSEEEVDVNLIIKALDIAKKTPSVCNRQGWHTWVVTEPTMIDEFRRVHNGFAEKNQNLATLLVMTFKKDVFDYPLERNQGFTDAGLFSMSVMYALTSVGLASCPLNSNLLIKDKKEFSKRVGIPQNYTIVMFIAVGNYLESNRTPISHRYPVLDKTTFL